MSVRSNSSNVWQYFKIAAAHSPKAECLLCRAQISRGGLNTSNFNTSNLRTHLKRKHAEIQVQNENPDQNLLGLPGPSSTLSEKNDSPKPPKIQPTLLQVLKKKEKFRKGGPQDTAITNKIAEMVCVDLQPLTIVEDVGFRRLVSHLEERYEMVSRKTLSTVVIPKIVKSVSEKISEIVTTASTFSNTSDIWTSKSGNDFISVTVHFIDDDWQLQHLLLEVLPFSGESHTAVNIEENLRVCFRKWRIEIGNISAMVTDSAANMKSAVTRLDITSVSCMVHSLQLVVNSGCLKQKSVANVVGTARRLVGHYHHSVLAKKSLTKAQNDLNIPQHCLIQDEPTRWDSTYLMLERLCEQRRALALACQSLSLGHGMELTNQDWELAEILLKILKLFWEATKTLSDEQSTLADCIPVVNSIKTGLQSLCGEQRVKMLTNELIGEMNRRFSDLERSTPHALATLLDPRYKDKVFLNEVQKKEAIEALKFEIRTAVEVVDDDASSVSISDVRSKSELFGFMSDIIQKNSASETATPTHDVGAHQLETFLQEPLLSHGLSPFDYWKHCAHLPVLRNASKKYLGIPPGSVFSERTFSISGLVCNYRRNRMAPATLQNLLFLHKNLKFLNFSY